jgi:hypothetical protein
VFPGVYAIVEWTAGRRVFGTGGMEGRKTVRGWSVRRSDKKHEKLFDAHVATIGMEVINTIPPRPALSRKRPVVRE